jgi:hypothetical protein
VPPPAIRTAIQRRGRRAAPLIAFVAFALLSALGAFVVAMVLLARSGNQSLLAAVPDGSQDLTADATLMALPIGVVTALSLARLAVLAAGLQGLPVGAAFPQMSVPRDCLLLSAAAASAFWVFVGLGMNWAYTPSAVLSAEENALRSMILAAVFLAVANAMAVIAARAALRVSASEALAEPPGAPER